MGFGVPDEERTALEETYEDTAVISRMETRQTGAIDRPSPAPVYSGIRCALSRRSDSSRQTAAQQDVEYDCVLFAAPELDVKPGDGVTVSRFGVEELFEAVGRPARYATHQEIFLKGRDLP